MMCTVLLGDVASWSVCSSFAVDCSDVAGTFLCAESIAAHCAIAVDTVQE